MAFPPDARDIIPIGLISGQPIHPDRLLNIPGHPFQNWNRNPGAETMFHVCDGSFLTFSHARAITVVTDEKCTLDRSARGRAAQRRWRAESDRGGNASTRNRIAAAIYNPGVPFPGREYLQRGLQPWYPHMLLPAYHVNMVPGGANRNHDWVVVINLDEYEPREHINDWSGRSNRQLRAAVRATMHGLYYPRELPPGSPTTNTTTPIGWNDQAKISVAFTLIGSHPDLRFGYDNSAEQIMGTVLCWLGMHPNRRRKFTDVYFLIPPKRDAGAGIRDATFNAWKKAWDHYITDRRPRNPPEVGIRLSRADQETLRQANEMTGNGDLLIAAPPDPDVRREWRDARVAMLDPIKYMNIVESRPINDYVQLAFGKKTRRGVYTKYLS